MTTSGIPTAHWAGHSRALLLSLLPFSAAMFWSLWHVMALVNVLSGKGGSPMALTWFVAFLMLWWVLVAWFEIPTTATERETAILDEYIVTVHIPVYNEDPPALKTCLMSLFEQTRPPNRIRVVDDGLDESLKEGYRAIWRWCSEEADRLGIYITWDRTVNRGKRHAQMVVLQDDPADVIVTLDSDSALDRKAIAEGLKPFEDPEVMSVAGMVVVWNSKDNFLTMLTCMLYNAFTRGFRSAQSVMGQVMVNSGTLAFYRVHVVRVSPVSTRTRHS